MIRPHETEKSYAKENRRLWRCRVGAYPKLASSSGPELVLARTHKLEN